MHCWGWVLRGITVEKEEVEWIKIRKWIAVITYNEGCDVWQRGSRRNLEPEAMNINSIQ